MNNAYYLSLLFISIIVNYFQCLTTILQNSAQRLDLTVPANRHIKSELHCAARCSAAQCIKSQHDTLARHDVTIVC